jgi:hypothetical protein
MSQTKPVRAKAPGKPKAGDYWVVQLLGEREVVLVSGDAGDRILTCGNDESFRTDRKDIGLKWIRKIRL